MYERGYGCKFCLGSGYVEARDYDNDKRIRHVCPECDRDKYRGRDDYERRRVEEEYRYKVMQMQNETKYWPSPHHMGWDMAAPEKTETKKTEQPKKKETKGMNYSTAVMLINENIRAVKVIYEPELQANGSKRTQTPYLFKTLDQSIKNGDYVVVPTTTRHGMTVVQVLEADAEVDFESSVEIKWLIGKVDLTDSTKIAAEEAKCIEALKLSEKNRKRNEIKKNLLATYEDAGLEKLAIANMGGAATPVIDSK